MSLSFPASPTNGQQYQNWQWNSSVGAWVPNYAAGFVTSFGGRSGAVNLQPGDNTSGNRVLLAQSVVTTPVASVGLLYNFTNQYDIIDVEAYDYIISPENPLMLRQSWDGSTFDASANYLAGFMYASSNTVTGSNQTALTYMILTSTVGANYPNFASVRLNKPAASALHWMRFMSTSFASAGTLPLYGMGGLGGSNGVLPIKGLQFAAYAGNITQGTFKIFGVVN